MTGSSHDDLLSRRADYPVLATSTYLANHTLGAMHRRTPERLADYAALCAERVPTYHIEASHAIDPDAFGIHYRPALVKHTEADATDWLPPGPVRVGVTAGALLPFSPLLLVAGVLVWRSRRRTPGPAGA